MWKESDLGGVLKMRLARRLVDVGSNPEDDAAYVMKKCADQQIGGWSFPHLCIAELIYSVLHLAARTERGEYLTYLPQKMR